VSQPPFGRIAIYGLGLIGGSIALAVKRRWPAATVLGIDRPNVVEAAVRMGAAEGGGEHLRVAAAADLVLLAAPVLQNVAALETLASHLPQPAVITDVGSTKRVMAEAARCLPERLRFIGGHPLSGAAVSGVEAARPDLFDDRPWILTGTEQAPPADVEALTQFVTGLRAVPHHMDPETHDRLLAYLSHLPQLTVSALMHVVGRHAGPEGLALAGRGLRDTTRLASSPAATWRDIAATNADHISAAIDDLIGALQQLKASSNGTLPELDAIFVSAARWKGVLEHN
jgi:prephenate dehydrogenase